MSMIVLPPVIDRTTAGALVAQMDQALAAGDELIVEGRDVGRVGQAGLQLLLSAQLSAQARGVPFTVHASPAMAAAADVSGLASTFNWVNDSHDQ